MANLPPQPQSELLAACQELSALAQRCLSAAKYAETSNELVKADAFRQLQLAAEPLMAAASAVKEQVNAASEVQGLLGLVAITTTPTGVPFDALVAETSLSTRAFNVLRYGDVITIRQLCSLEMGDFMKFRNCGKATIDEIAALRESIGVPLIGWK